MMTANRKPKNELGTLKDRNSEEKQLQKLSLKTT